MNPEGIIFDIQRFSLHDGPGIRTTVFMKGCPLQCVWCSNPESQSVCPEIAYFKKKCTLCKRCLAVCSEHALQFNHSQDLQVDRDRCNLCGKCVSHCPAGSIKLIGNTWTVSEVVDLIKRDAVFYRRSGGGITISGGEPLYQAHFVRELLKTCKELYFHTTVQTSGYAEWDNIKMIRPFADLFLFDLKAIDSVQHQLFTGRDNAMIKENFDRLLRTGNKDLVAQIPIIPGYNDSKHSIQQFVDFLLERKSLPKGVNIIPYHRLGAAKYVSLGREYNLHEVEPANSNYIESIRNHFRSHGLNVLIYG